jgi:hypothetical protein
MRKQGQQETSNHTDYESCANSPYWLRSALIGMVLSALSSPIKNMEVLLGGATRAMGKVVVW